MQTEQVIIDIICTESEQEILRVLMEKWQRYDELERKMGEIIRKYGLHQNAAAAMARSIGVDRVEVRGERFTAVNNDCVEETARMETDSIDPVSYTHLDVYKRQLYQMLTSWRGKALSDAELDQAGDGFDLMQMAGQGAMLSVSVAEKDDGSRHNKIEMCIRDR